MQTVQTMIRLLLGAVWSRSSLFPSPLSILRDKCTIKTLNYNTTLLSCRRQITLSNIDEICPLLIPNQISFISMHVPSLVKIPWHLLKLLSGNQNMGVSWADNYVKIWKNLRISIPKPDLNNISVYTKFGENPLMFTQVIIRKRKYGRVSSR